MGTALTGGVEPSPRQTVRTMQPSRNKVRFVLGSTPLEISLDDPGLTLLDYLRNQACLTGTKEGCAEGDCGACTVLIAELYDNSLKYTAANACILLLGMVDGKQVLTVEHLASDTLHPAQQAMIDHHGSQCGFCTPGFVMSIAALQLDMRHGDSIQTPDREQIDQQLAGNLCRCTGYGPIIDAARQACTQPLPDYWSHQQTAVQSILGQWQKQDDTLHVECESGLFAAPRTEAELVTYLSDQHSPPTLLAGATDIGLWITKQGRQLATLLYLGQISSLKTVNRREDELEIGAAVSLQRAEPELTRLSPDLGLLLRRFGARQVRSQGTIGGNIANGSPIGDLPPALIALGATLRIGCANGQREIPLEDFFVDYGQQDLADNEYVASVVLPAHPQPHFRCWKIAKRFDQDISAVLGAFSLTLVDGFVHNARFCFGGMATTPRRACRCEAAVEGRRLDEDTLAEAQNALQQDFDPIADLRASARYRRTVAANLLDKYFRFLNVTDVPSVYEFSSPQAFTHV